MPIFTWNWREIWTWRVSTDCVNNTKTEKLTALSVTRPLKISQQVPKNAKFNSAKNFAKTSWKVAKTWTFFSYIGRIGLSFATQKNVRKIREFDVFVNMLSYKCMKIVFIRYFKSINVSSLSTQEAQIHMFVEKIKKLNDQCDVYINDF